MPITTLLEPEVREVKPQTPPLQNITITIIVKSKLHESETQNGFSHLDLYSAPPPQKKTIHLLRKPLLETYDTIF